MNPTPVAPMAHTSTPAGSTISRMMPRLDKPLTTRAATGLITLTDPDPAARKLIDDFVVSSRLLAARDVESALKRLLPEPEGRTLERVRAMVAVGAVLTGTRSAASVRTTQLDADVRHDGLARVLAAQCLTAGAQLDSGALRELTATHGEVLVDVLVELMIRFVELDEQTRGSGPDLEWLTCGPVLGEVVALAEEAAQLTDDQLRTRLTGLADAARRLAGDPR